MIATDRRDNIKRWIGVVLTIVMFVLFYISTDPDAKLLTDLPYGVPLILSLNIFVTAMFGIIVIEFFLDFFIDIIYGNEKDLRVKAYESPQGAGLVMIAKSLRILAFAIIVAAAILTLNVN